MASLPGRNGVEAITVKLDYDRVRHLSLLPLFVDCSGLLVTKLAAVKNSRLCGVRAFAGKFFITHPASTRG